MKLRKPFIIFFLGLSILAFADGCKSKGVYGRRGGGGHKGGGCDCPGIGKH